MELKLLSVPLRFLKILSLNVTFGPVRKYDLFFLDLIFGYDFQLLRFLFWFTKTTIEVENMTTWRFY